MNEAVKHLDRDNEIYSKMQLKRWKSSSETGHHVKIKTPI